MENNNKKETDSKNNTEKTQSPNTGKNQKTTEKEGKKTSGEENQAKINKETLSKVLERIETLEKSLKEKDKEIEMLTKISDKSRLLKYQQKENKEIIRQAKVSVWNDVPILAWDTITDEVGYRDGRLQVNQVVRLFLDEKDDDGKPKTTELNYLYWVQNVRQVVGDIVGNSDYNGNKYQTIELPDGRKINIDIRFINAF